MQQAAVVGLPDSRWGEAVHAFIILRPDSDTDANALQAHCREHIAAYKVPKFITFIDSLPLSPAGKMLKTDLQAMLTT